MNKERDNVTKDNGYVFADNISYAEGVPLEARTKYQPEIKGKIEANDLVIGIGVVIEEGAEIHADKLVLGDFAYIGKDVKILTSDLKVGEYTTVHSRSTFHGRLPLEIGNKCWFGNGVRLDTQGGLTIGNGVGMGDDTKVWTHIQFGDVSGGLNPSFFSRWETNIPDDVWFVGETKVHNAQIETKTMFLEGTTVRGKTKANHVYGMDGSKMVDLTSKTGTQFLHSTSEQRLQLLEYFILRFEQKYPQYTGQLRAVKSVQELHDSSTTAFISSNQTYTKKYSDAEILFNRKLGPLCKYYPLTSENISSVSRENLEYSGEFSLDSIIDKLKDYQIF